MEDYIEIEIIVNTPHISDLHETITSILHQTNQSRLGLRVRFTNHNELDLSLEKTRLKSSGIKIIEKPSTCRFFISLTNGEIISPSFLYKGMHFLIKNSALFVCPEYTFRRLDNSLIITATTNHQMLYNNLSARLLDREKISQDIPSSPRASIIKDTCSALNTIDLPLDKYLKTLDSAPSLDFSSFSLTPQIDPDAPRLFNPLFSSPTFKQKLKSFTKKILHSFLQNKPLTPRTYTQPYISPKMHYELSCLSDIKYGLKGFCSMEFTNVTYESFFQSERLFAMYCKISQYLVSEKYSYVMVLPWLIPGGIDLFAINYLNTLAELMPTKQILVLLTNGTHKSFSKADLHFADNITLIDLPLIFQNDKRMLDLQPELIYSILNTYRPSRFHLIASKAGYDCLIKYNSEIRNLGIKILFSSYNYLVGSHNEYTGYSIQELPLAYRQGDIITTDNQNAINLWTEHFGFSTKDILLHHQLFDVGFNNISSQSTKDGIRILWAAHVRPEKNPEILPAIAKALQKDNIDIDCYGIFTPLAWPDGKNPLHTKLPNLHYMGPYGNFFKDIDLQKYDLFLYTSHSEGTPNVIIEAALANLPIVASRIGGIPDALGDNAALVDDTYSPEQFISAIRSTLSNSTKSHQKAHSLQQKLLSKHSKEVFIKQVKEMLEKSKS